MKKIILLLSTMQLLFANVSYEKLDYSVIQLEERTINQYEKHYFTIDVPDGSELVVKLVDLSADVDLYVTQGLTVPTLRSSYCKSVNGGIEEEECRVSTPNYKRHNIMVYGFRDATYKIVPSLKKENDATLLGKNSIKSHLSRDKHHAYKVASKAGETVTVRLSELTGDADLKLKVGKVVTKNSFTCKSTNGGTKVDECTVTVPTDEMEGVIYIYIDVFGFRTADYKIERFKSGSTTTENSCITRDQLKEKIRNNENVENVNTSCITNMSHMFFTNDNFNQDISTWDVSNVTNMNSMFMNTLSFDQDISGWDVSNVENMKNMFKGKDACLNFNQDISSWNVSKVKNMDSMFWQNCYDEYNFKNHDLSSWDVSNVTSHELFFLQNSTHNNIEPLWN